MRVPNSWHTGWDPHGRQDRVIPQEHVVLRSKCGPEQAGTCGRISSPQTGTVALGWPLHLSWPLPHPGQSGRSLKEASMQGLQPWTFSSVGGSSGVRETHRGSFVNGGAPLPHPEMGA